ncbi:MAG: aspartate ammonia-lyase [Thermoanaerobacteraceae bacterium]|nr:aspartate ammonia-lyase [Thermoanaerobacteraceae bacterium]
MSYRVERDMLGEMPVPAGAYYGIHTLRARENFPVSGFPVHPRLIRALALVKGAAAAANVKAGLLDEKTGAAIQQAAAEVARGHFYDQFIVDALQGGAGTSTNMNMNEVLANRACELLGGQKGDYHLVHPLHHVNLSQSTNDVYPTALRVAAVQMVLELSGEMARLQGALQEKEAAFAGILKLGRTEMQDAVPITLGQEFGAWAEAIARDRWRLYKVEERLRQVNLGGTAVGTGLNARRQYIYQVIEELQALTGLGLARAENMVDGTQNADVFVEVSGLVKAAAVNLAKMAGDLRLLSSGPGGGLAEINLPRLQAGSSIMPGKVNPVIPEMVTQVSYQVICGDQAIALAAASGRLELNAFLPLIAFNLLHGLEMLTNAAVLLRTRCIEGITANEKRCRFWLEESRGEATALVPYIGYEEACRLVEKAMAGGKTIRETARESGLFTAEELDIIFAPGELTRPGIAGSRKLKHKLPAKNNHFD